MRLEGKRIVVTGAAGGLGRAISTGFAREGAKVVCLDINREGAAQVAAHIREFGGTANHITCDIRELVEVERALASALDFLHGVDVLMAAAGGSGGEEVPFLELDIETWQRMRSRNLDGNFNCGLVFARFMAASGGGVIIFLGSQLAEVVRPGFAHYSAAKGGLKLLMKGMAVDLASHGIRVNGVAPGPTWTEANRAYFSRPEIAEGNRRQIPLGRLADPEEIVGAAVYLASDESSFVTGATILVDGGYTLQ